MFIESCMFLQDGQHEAQQRDISPSALLGLSGLSSEPIHVQPESIGAQGF